MCSARRVTALALSGSRLRLGVSDIGWTAGVMGACAGLRESGSGCERSCDWAALNPGSRDHETESHRMQLRSHAYATAISS